MSHVQKALTSERFKFSIPDLNDDVVDTINRLYDQLVDRTPRNQLRAAFYDCKYAIESIGSVIPPEYLRTATVLGWSAKSVDTLARRCNLDEFFWPDGDLDSIGGTKLWDDNWFATKANNGMVSSLIHGPAFLINTDGDPDDGEPDSLIHVKSALQATGDWNARANRMDRLLSILERDDETGNPTAIALYEDGVTVTSRKDPADGTWSSDVQTHSYGVPVEVLPYHPREDRTMGSSRITRPVMSLHRRAIKAAIRMDGHADVYSFPQLILLGAQAANFKNPDGTVRQAWQIALARVFALPDDPDEPEAARARADVKQFPASSPEPHIRMMEQIAMMFSGETSIPVESLGFSNRANPTSPDAYIAAREDLIAEAEGATDDWAPAFRRSFQRGLAMLNNEDGIPEAYRSIDAKFRSPVYLSRAAQADAGSKQLSSGPEWLKETTVGLELLGLDAQQIKRALAEKRRLGVTNVVEALTQGGAGEEVPEEDQPDVIDGEVDQRALPAGRRLAAVDGNRGA
ncbi:portal protein [Mycobacterium phage Antsirabe]|uniref:Portal protein n=1 Tax=Mycobacterium phage Antsirabe TaxID=2575610 RepID=A0A5J6TJ23_9CAUD|nr:portal protein [Mycobacterium phage Antsirabe]QFG09957.1 portal protein [Mycobacterium phage Antsirabe]